MPTCAPALGNPRAERSHKVLAPEFPLVIAEWGRNSREVIRVALDQYNGRHTINLRVWYRDGAELKPGRTGITLAVKHLPQLAHALSEAVARADELCLTDEGGER